MCNTHFREGFGLSSTGCVPWQGYLAYISAEGVLIQDPHFVENSRVHGPDSDYNCLVISGLHLLKDEIGNVENVLLPESLDHSTIAAATSITNGDSIWKVILNQDASIAITRGEQVFDEYSVNGVNMDKEFYQEMEDAWTRELLEENVSQGAYVSAQQYRFSEDSRLSLSGQLVDEIAIWPPRANVVLGGKLELDRRGEIISWTSLSSVGAPSEFSIRAPVLDGITTVLIEFDKGPKGVFLLCDDENRNPVIGEIVELVVRKLYAQEGIMRYGLKARYPI